MSIFSERNKYEELCDNMIISCDCGNCLALNDGLELRKISDLSMQYV